MKTEGIVRFDHTEKLVIADNLQSVKPMYGKASISDAPSIISRTLGLKITGNKSPIAGKDFPHVDRLIFFFLDGFGTSTVRWALEKFNLPHTQEFIDKADLDVITSTFPSTTSTATISCHSGLTPGEHGVIGYTQYLSSIGTVCNMINMSPLGLKGRSISDHVLNSTPDLIGNTIHSSLTKDGVKSFYYSPRAISKSGLTKITTGSAIIRPYLSHSHLFTLLKSDLERERGQSLHFCYIPTVDTISHKVGPYTEETANEIESIFHMILEFSKNLNTANTGILISADHGHTVVPRENIRDIAGDTKLRNNMICPAVGDLRAPFLHLRKDTMGESVEHILENFDGFAPINFKDAVKKGLIGPCDLRKLRFGSGEDIVIMPPDGTAIFDSTLSTLDPDSSEIDMIGMHGGLSREEMEIPLISYFRNR